jgi:hypothetical protein
VSNTLQSALGLEVRFVLTILDCPTEVHPFYGQSEEKTALGSPWVMFDRCPPRLLIFANGATHFQVRTSGHSTKTTDSGGQVQPTEQTCFQIRKNLCSRFGHFFVALKCSPTLARMDDERQNASETSFFSLSQLNSGEHQDI